jgi:hypothetical protein
MLNVVMLSVIMLSVIMLSVIMLSVIMLSVIILSVIVLNVVMPSVVAPLKTGVNKLDQISNSLKCHFGTSLLIGILNVHYPIPGTQM